MTDQRSAYRHWEFKPSTFTVPDLRAAHDSLVQLDVERTAMPLANIPDEGIAFLAQNGVPRVGVLGHVST